MRSEDAAALLAQTQIFGELSPLALASVADRAIDRSYKKGQLIFHEGDLGDSLFVIVGGVVKVVVTSEEGDEMVLVTLRAPETFGELAVIDGGPRSASAETLEPTTVLVVTRSILLEVLREHPPITEALLRSLGGLVRRLTEQASDLVFLDLPGRVAKLLLGLADDQGTKEDQGTVLDLHMTQTDLAGLVGGSRQSVNQILRAFESRGYVEFHGRTVVIKDAALLRRRAGLT
ncbi:MAG: Crp/Fnr family transcriptional regulator [Actinomycetota bacterium]|nr:Crp/Fnr family transcriptional regulator [Actinomycetota bacterium]